MRLSANLGSKNLKTGVQNGPKLKRGSGTQEGHLVVLEYWLAQMWGTARGLLNWDKPYIFLFFRDKDAFVLIGTFQVPIGTSQVPIGTNARHGPRASELR